MALSLTNGQYDGVVTCAVGVTDFDAAIKWYQQVLGFELIFRLDDAGWAEMKTPTANLHLGLTVKEKVDVGGGAIVTFGVHDVDNARKELEAHKVKMEDMVEVPGMVKLFTFFDPDGNALMMAQDLMRQAQGG